MGGLPLPPSIIEGDWQNFRHSPLSEYGRFPPAADAKNQPLDSSGGNLLIHNGLAGALCGLRATLGERIWREKWLGERKFRPISVRPGKIEVRKNPQETSWVRGRTKKMTNCRNSWSSILVGRRLPNNSLKPLQCNDLAFNDLRVTPKVTPSSRMLPCFRRTASADFRPTDVATPRADLHNHIEIIKAITAGQAP